MRHYRQLTITDRLNIEQWLKEGMKKGEIAQRLRVHRNTITNELKRGEYMHMNSDLTMEKRYSPYVAETKYRDNLKAKGPDYKIGSDIAFADFIEKLMLGVQEDGTIDKKKRFSPAAALAEARKKDFATSICTATLYSYIRKGDVFFALTERDLIVKGKKGRGSKGGKPRPARAPKGESIERRPEEINERARPGDWEMDSVVGRQGTKECLVVLTERYIRMEMAFLVPDHTAASVVRVLNEIEEGMGSERFRQTFLSITVDNGSEFQDCEGMEHSADGTQRTKLYYCHPYSSYERGSNENQNRMIRRFYPKGFNFADTTQEEVDRALAWINQYPRQALEWRSSGELYEELFKAA